MPIARNLFSLITKSTFNASKKNKNIKLMNKFSSTISIDRSKENFNRSKETFKSSSNDVKLNDVKVVNDGEKGEELDENEDMEEMFIEGPAGREWGGPTRGGRFREPTRYGDWERKGRCSDF